MGIPPARGKGICVRDTTGLQVFIMLMIFSRHLSVSSVLAPIGLPVKLQLENKYSLSRCCSSLFQACIANWKCERHWWTVTVLTSKEKEFSKAILIFLG